MTHPRAALAAITLCLSSVAAAQFTIPAAELIGSGEVGYPGQGFAVALSSDGTTAVVGGPGDDNNVGAVWVFVRSGGVWTQQGAKLVGTGALPGHREPGVQNEGTSRSRSPTTATLSLWVDQTTTTTPTRHTRTGRRPVPRGCLRSNGVWTQQAKLVGSNWIGGAFRAPPWPSPLTAIPPLWEDLATAFPLARSGSLLAPAPFGRSRQVGDR